MYYYFSKNEKNIAKICCKWVEIQLERLPYFGQKRRNLIFIFDWFNHIFKGQFFWQIWARSKNSILKIANQEKFLFNKFCWQWFQKHLMKASVLTIRHFNIFIVWGKSLKIQVFLINGSRFVVQKINLTGSSTVAEIMAQVVYFSFFPKITENHLTK